jgi:hypothetical protein
MTETTVQIFHNAQLVATHVRKAAGKQTLTSHYPPEKVGFQVKTPDWCRRQAEDIGPACAEVIDSLLEIGAVFRLRAAQGIVGLAAKHTAARLEAACVKAIAVGDPSYRTIKGILAVGAETEPAPAGSGDGGAGAFLHGPSQLFADVVPLPTASRTTAADQSSATC